MVRDRFFALLALAVFLAFMSIVAVKIARVDLFMAIGIGVALVCYDVWTQLFTRRR